MNLNEKLSLLVDHQHPLQSPNTRAVAASLIFGGKLAEDGYRHVIEEGPNGRPRHTTIFLLKDSEITFNPFEGEKISQAELLKRWNDRKWIEENPDHPISAAKEILNQLDILRDFTNSRTPQIKLVRGGRIAIIDTVAGENGKPVPSEDGKKMLEKFLK